MLLLTFGITIFDKTDAPLNATLGAAAVRAHTPQISLFKHLTKLKTHTIQMSHSKEKINLVVSSINYRVPKSYSSETEKAKLFTV